MGGVSVVHQRLRTKVETDRPVFARSYLLQAEGIPPAPHIHPSGLLPQLHPLSIFPLNGKAAKQITQPRDREGFLHPILIAERVEKQGPLMKGMANAHLQTHRPRRSPADHRDHENPRDKLQDAEKFSAQISRSKKLSCV